MRCQHCNQNEANVQVRYNINGHIGELMLCDDCARPMQAQTGSAPRLVFELGSTGFFGPVETLLNPEAFAPFSAIEGSVNLGGRMPLNVRTVAEQATPPIDADLLRRRKCNELQAQLDSAIGREDYEEAARLRDGLARILQQPNSDGKEAYTHE